MANEVTADVSYEPGTTNEAITNMAHEVPTVAALFLNDADDKPLMTANDSGNSSSEAVVSSLPDEASAEILTAKVVDGRSTETSVDTEQWRIDIWNSYGTGEINPPSPMGYQ
jgi:hypothetical protein